MKFRLRVAEIQWKLFQGLFHQKFGLSADWSFFPLVVHGGSIELERTAQKIF